MKKSYIIIIIIVFFLLIFCALYYNLQKNGNTIINKKEIIESLLENNLNYTAEIEVEVNSNKNTNIYKIKQEEKENYSRQEVVEGKNMEGLVVELNNKTLKISNTTLNLQKIYENYNNLSNNYLFLSSFIKDCKDENNVVEKIEDGENYLIKVKLTNGEYIKDKELYISKKTNKPIKMIINSSYHKQKASIRYINIEIN